MKPFSSTASKAASAGLLAVACVLLAAPAHAGSLVVRDKDGSQWVVVEDPADDRDDYLLKRTQADRKPDLRFGRDGATNFTMGSDNDSPTSVRVEAANRRVWAVGSNLSGNQPQPVVARFDANGGIDTRWGVQGKVQLAPSGMAMRPNDVMPLSDGSVLVAGDMPNMGSPRAIVFRLKPDGSLDTSFGRGGVWQRPGTEPAAATSLAVGGDGSVAVSVMLRGQKPMGEIWTLGDVPPQLIAKDPLDDSIDEEDTRIEWVGDHFGWNTNGGPTQPVPPASLEHRAAAQTPASSPSTDPGGGAFNPFAANSNASAASAPQADDDGLPWLWVGLAAALAVGLTALFFKRGREPEPGPRQDARR
jgi:hypothetical protein